jgi:hypothetical protein
MAPIKGSKIKAPTNRMFEDLKSKSFLSHRAFIRKPRPRNETHVKKSEIIVWVSLNASPMPIGIMVSRPEICRRKPMFAKILLFIWLPSFVTPGSAKSFAGF